MSNASCFQLLFEQFPLVNKQSLWVLDENPPLNCPAPNPLISVISNRFDVVQSMKNRGYNAHFNDFDFSIFDAKSFQYIFYRLSKEKALAHHIINQAFYLLSKQGSLIISGAKQEGIKGYLERIATIYRKERIFKADKQHWAGEFRQVEVVENFLDDKNYAQLRSFSQDHCIDSRQDIYSKPGIFGWDKIDQGSKLLINTLANLFADKEPPQNILDIGCGYGYLSLNCARLFKAKVVASDNNAAAVSACAYNLAAHSVEHEVLATNCTQGIDEKFDLIVCNPPFHSGFGVENDLTDVFLKGAKERLASVGTAIFVTNLHIPIERKGKKYFHKVEIVAQDNHFKIVVFRH